MRHPKVKVKFRVKPDCAVGVYSSSTNKKGEP